MKPLYSVAFESDCIDAYFEFRSDPGDQIHIITQIIKDPAKYVDSLNTILALENIRYVIYNNYRYQWSTSHIGEGTNNDGGVLADSMYMTIKRRTAGEPFSDAILLST